MGVGEKYYRDYVCYRIFHGTADRSGNHIEIPRDFMIPREIFKK
jgi:hypothetical protein